MAFPKRHIEMNIQLQVLTVYVYKFVIYAITQ